MEHQWITKRFNDLSNMIGNTPLLELKLTYKGEERTVYAKAEYYNLTGSIKDRMAFHVLQKAYKSGKLKKGDRIVEATSGNTGIAFSAIGRSLGHPVTIFMPNWMSQERINLIRSYGADIELVSKEQGGFLGSIQMTEDLAEHNEGVFLPRQFSNEDNSEAHYMTTGPEIWWQLQVREIKPDAFVAGVGTGGTVMGTGRFLKEMNPEIKIYPLEPANSPTMSTGHKVGSHRIQGISDEFIPSIVDLGALDEVIDIDDGDAILMTQRLASELGVGVGISSGANLLGALKVQDIIGSDKVVVTIFSDDNKKYLSTDLMKEEPIKDGFLSPHVTIKSMRTLKRVCYTCCDPNGCTDVVMMPELPPCPLRHCRQ